MYSDFLNKQYSVGVIGLGYVGLPLALEFAKKFKVIAFDINESRISLLKQNIDPNKELNFKDFENTDITFTSDLRLLQSVKFFIVAVPTPIDEYNQPDLSALLAASVTVGKCLKKGDYVVYESTVFPGCTEEKCIPILEKESDLEFIKDFKVGYSPERINPGDKEHTLINVKKVVSGCDTESLELISKIYETIVLAGVHKATSIKVAEASKVVENVQRDLNIALMNELSMIFDKLEINTFEVLEAASTKWNFLKFSPGLVGGHCIGVDPYYLTYKSTNLGHNPKVILSGREINDSMGYYVARKTIRLMTGNKIDIPNARVLILGVTFKENVSDIRNSKVVDVIKELNAFNIHVEAVDPFASHEDFESEYGIKLYNEPNGIYDAVILAVAHSGYVQLSEEYFNGILKKNGVFVDVKGIFRSKFKNWPYWSL